MAVRRAGSPKYVSPPGVGTGTDYPQYRGLADRICTLVSAPTHSVSGLGLPSRPSICGTLQFPLRDRTHSGISSPGGRHRGFLVPISPGEAVARVAASTIDIAHKCPMLFPHLTRQQIIIDGTWQTTDHHHRLTGTLSSSAPF